jgi:CheY-like chemotaxis protein
MNHYPTILLVDDSENDLFLARTAFERAGFNSSLQEVRNGVEAIAYLKGEGPYSDRTKWPMPAVMLLDLNMPMKNGFDVLDWVRTQPGLRRLAIIVLSASMRTQDVERAFDLGANSFLVKPGRMEDFIEMIRCLRDWLRYNHFPPLNETVIR